MFIFSWEEKLTFYQLLLYLFMDDAVTIDFDTILMIYILIGWLGGWVLWDIKPWSIFNAKSVLYICIKRIVCR